MKKNKKTYWLDKKENIKKILYVFFALCALLFAADFLLHRHTYHTLEEIPAFYTLFGFIAYVIIVCTATLLRKIVMQPEDYYEAPEEKHND